MAPLCAGRYYKHRLFPQSPLAEYGMPSASDVMST